jgi:hypothetical protein
MISYSDVTRYLEDNKYKYSVSEVHSPPNGNSEPFTISYENCDNDIQRIEDDTSTLSRKSDIIRKSIIQKLKDSNDIKNEKIRLLALTPLLRIRLRKNLNRGEIGMSWDSSLDFCTVHELMRLFQSVDVCFTLDEVTYLSAAISDEKDSFGSSYGATSNSILQGITLSKMMLFLADLITQNSLY